MDAGSLPDVRENQDRKLANSPSSSKEVFISKQEDYFEKNPRSKQKLINKLENLIKIMKSKSENLSQMAEDGLGKTSENIDTCLSESSSQYLLLTTLIDIITSCTYSMDILQNYIKHYLPQSTKCSTDTNHQEQAEIGKIYEIDDHGLIKVPMQEVVHALVEILPTFFTEDSQIGEQLKALARKVSRAENSCDICVRELKTVWIIIQKMFLLLSEGGNKPEVKYSIDELVSCLLRANFPSESESDMCLLNDNHSFLSESISSIYLLPFVGDDCSVQSDCNDVKSNDDLESLESEFESEEINTNLQRINMNFQRQYLKITHIESPYTSEEFCNGSEALKTELSGKYNEEKDCISLDLGSQGNACASLSVKKCDGSNDVGNDKLFQRSLRKFWMSLNSLPKSKTTAEKQSDVQSNLSSNSSKIRVADSDEKSQHVQHTLNKPGDRFPPNSKPGVDGGNSYPNSRTTSSSFTNSSNFEHATDTSRKIRTETVLVKLANGGEGFGLVLGAKYNSTRSLIVPVIHSLKLKSPAHRSGLLKVDDRIIAINHQSTLGLTPNELQELSNQSFSAEAVSLKVEFDVVEVQPKFGNFDVVLDKKLKVGLLFEDMRRGFPMVVSGIVKGSGAHRSGQLFPGDKIKFFRCIRNEEFDTVSCNYNKEESVLITVQRDPPAGLRRKSASAPPCYSNPFSSHVVPRRGKSFVVRKEAVRTVGGTKVLYQEVTLFRDPVCWDFGFLVGENPDTGRAYVTDIRPNGPAFDSGAVKKLDRIVQVNGVPVDRNVENSVLALLSQANHKVDLLIRRFYREDSSTLPKGLP